MTENGKNTRFVGFKCPIDIYNTYLAGKENVSRVIIKSLTGPVKPAVKPEEGSVKPGLNPVKPTMIFLKLFNTLGECDPSRARELFESLTSDEQVILREFLESNQ